MSRIPISVLTGFLGSGKTTVLNHLVGQPELNRTLVLINEFGEIGLDHDLVTRSSDDVVVEMSSGCLCCTIRGDLAKTLHEAPGRFTREGERWFNRVVIETTGLADPAPILHTLMSEPSVARRYHLDGVIATIDAVNGMDTLDRQEESVRQAAVADRLLITKADLADHDVLTHLRARLRTLNPAAPQLTVENGSVDPSLLFNAGPYDPAARTVDVQNWLREEAHNEGHAHGTADPGHEHEHPHPHEHDHDRGHDHDHDDVNRHDSRIRAHCVALDEPVEAAAFDLWLNALLLFRGANFLRTKGILHVRGQDRPIVIHGVQHVFHPAASLPEWPSEDRRSRIVFITRDIDEPTLRKTLKILKLSGPEIRNHRSAEPGENDPAPSVQAVDIRS